MREDDVETKQVLNQLGLSHLTPRFAAEEVDFEALSLLGPEDLAGLGASPVEAARIRAGLAREGGAGPRVEAVAECPICLDAPRDTACVPPEPGAHPRRALRRLPGCAAAAAAASWCAR